MRISNEAKVVVLICGTLVLAAAFGVTVCQKENKNCRRAVVKTVGGCDSSGRCGVILEDGSASVASYPVVGESVCVR